MNQQSIRHFTDLEGGVSRRAILKGMFSSAAVGVLLPYAILEQQISQTESLQQSFMGCHVILRFHLESQII